MGSLSPREMSSFCIFGKKAIIMKREGEIRIPSGCAISAVISREGRRMTGEAVMKSMIPMHDRSNGLGGRLCRLRHLPRLPRFLCVSHFL